MRIIEERRDSLVACVFAAGHGPVTHRVDLRGSKDSLSPERKILVREFLRGSPVRRYELCCILCNGLPAKVMG